ncbi:MAG: hypothetical protein KME17_14990 [Cyanosarcina radialis HA8281-LM2]|nr:hypothetical protein [Cyanosarcina radialis HA8281-LM2]
MDSIRRYAIVIPSMAAILFLTVGCSESKVSQCSKIVKIATQTVKQTETIVPRGKKVTPETILKGAETMDKAAQSMSAIEVSDVKLKEYQGSFIKMYREIGKTIRAFGVAARQKDRIAAMSALKNWQQASFREQENRLATGIKSYCQSQ